MDNPAMFTQLVSLVTRLEGADEIELGQLRKELLGVLDRIGAMNFVQSMANIVKDDLHSEGCTDVRVPLKKIFSVSLDELTEALQTHEFGLPADHPIRMLAGEHKDGIEKLRLMASGAREITSGACGERTLEKLKQAHSYFLELDRHIRKEEEVLFPLLEENGMEEHPAVLRKEHQEFRRTMSELLAAIDRISSQQSELSADEIADFGENFIPGMSNHIFRETFIFYPAALEFIKTDAEWQEIRVGFAQI